MKNLLIKLGLWEEIDENLDFYQITHTEHTFLVNAKLHYCEPCNKWFKEMRATKAHQRLVHEGVMRKNA